MKRQLPRLVFLAAALLAAGAADAQIFFGLPPAVRFGVKKLHKDPAAPPSVPVVPHISGEKGWSVQLGTTTTDNGYRAVTDAAGNVYVAGVTDGGLDGNASAGGDDVFLVKYNSAGARQWTRQFGTALNDQASGVTVDASGDVYVAGNAAAGLDGNSSAGGLDMFLVKYSAAGAKQWTRQLGTASDEHSSGVAADVSSNVYVAVYTLGGLDGNTNAGGQDLFLVKYNSSGAKQWTKQLGTAADDWSFGAASDPGGNIYVCGVTNGGLDGNTSAGGYDMFLVKYDTAGARQWTRQLGTGFTDWGSDVEADSSGNVYVTGYTVGGLDGNTNAGGLDIFLVKYDSAGVKKWTRQLGTPLDDSGAGVAAGAADDIFVTGYTQGGLDGNASAGGLDMFLVKYNSSGSRQWTRQLGSGADDSGSGAVTDAAGYVYVTGKTDGAFDGNLSAGGQDMFLVKYAQ
ncbi:MAG: SBBP repeat-containing protein [Elusimicrobiota bacterium]